MIIKNLQMKLIRNIFKILKIRLIIINVMTNKEYNIILFICSNKIMNNIRIW